MYNPKLPSVKPLDSATRGGSELASRSLVGSWANSGSLEASVIIFRHVLVHLCTHSSSCCRSHSKWLLEAGLFPRYRPATAVPPGLPIVKSQYFAYQSRAKTCIYLHLRRKRFCHDRMTLVCSSGRQTPQHESLEGFQPCVGHTSVVNESSNSPWVVALQPQCG